MEARFDLLPDTALALAAVYLLFFAGAGSAAIGGWCRLRACPISSAAAENRAESEEALLWEKPELAQNAVELRIGFQGGAPRYCLAAEEYADRAGLASGLAKIAAAGENRTVRIVVEPAVPHAEVSAILRLCGDMGVTAFFPIPGKVEP